MENFTYWSPYTTDSILNDTVSCSAQGTDMERPVVEYPGMNFVI